AERRPHQGARRAAAKHRHRSRAGGSARGSAAAPGRRDVRRRHGDFRRLAVRRPRRALAEMNPDGLVYEPEFIATAEEAALLAGIRDLPLEEARYREF